MEREIKFTEVEEPYNEYDPDYERHIMRLSDRMWVSVLHRMTGFGYLEWETAIVVIRNEDDPLYQKRGKWDDRQCLIVRGDHRNTLEGMDESEIMAWYDLHQDERNSFETILDAAKEATQ